MVFVEVGVAAHGTCARVTAGVTIETNKKPRRICLPWPLMQSMRHPLGVTMQLLRTLFPARSL